MILGVIQARMKSTRLPGKVLMPMNGAPMLTHVIRRAMACRMIDRIVVVTSEEEADRQIIKVASNYCQAIATHKLLADGSNDVLSWFVHALAIYPGAQHLVRITGDCPLWCPLLGDEVIATHLASNVDYSSNVQQDVDGFDTEVLSVAALRLADREAMTAYDRHHVTPLVRRMASVLSISSKWINHGPHVGRAKLSVDRQIDFDVCEAIMKAGGGANWWQTIKVFKEKGYPRCSDMPSPSPTSSELEK